MTDMDDLCSEFASLRLSSKNYLKKAQVNKRFLESCWEEIGVVPIYDCLLKEVCENSPSYKYVADKFYMTNTRCQIIFIQEVINPFLLLEYELMRRCYLKTYGPPQQKYFFHGTRKCNVDSICKNNFDWRLRGKTFWFL